MDGASRCLRIDAAHIATPKEMVPSVQSAEILLTPGASYRLRASFRSDNPGSAKFMVYCPLDSTGKNKWEIWVTHPYEIKVSSGWKETEIVFTLPAPGQKEWRDTMGKYHVRFDWPAEQGSLFARDVTLEPVERLDLWKSWQETGPDRHSIVADPLFRNAAEDDYRLDPKSPAWALGFKPIPVEQIGPYADELRASWPIKEASGFRENAQKK
jgi:outer membrane protein assembly factor BamB